MRRLGSELGVEAMALYRYIPGREQLLDGVVEYVMNELYQKTMNEELPGSWQEYLQRMAHGVREHLRRPSPGVPAGGHPAAGRALAAAAVAQPPLGGELPGPRCSGSASPTHKSVGIYRAFSTFLLGHLLLESATVDLGAEVELDDDIEFFETNDLSQYPRLMALAAQLRRTGTRRSSRTRWRICSTGSRSSSTEECR